MPGPDGEPVVVHADLDFGGAGRLQLGEATPAYDTVPPPADGGACYSLGLYAPDVDAVTSGVWRADPRCGRGRGTSSRATASPPSSIPSTCAGRS